MMRTFLDLVIGIISLGIPTYVVFRVKPNMTWVKRWLIYVLAVGVTWILIVLATELSITLDMRFAHTEKAAQYIAEHDSGLRIGALVAGWLPATMYVTFLAWINLLKNKRKQPNNH